MLEMRHFEVDGTASHKGCAVVPARRHVTCLGLSNELRIAREPVGFGAKFELVT